MAEHDPKKDQQLLPDDEQGPKREAGDRPVPTPGHIGNLPDPANTPGTPVIKPPRH
ncbi:MAG TPA: hypothetical protein VFO83_03425 [Aggregicoccus sp.]|nr:hypothetical protein [Aggregicoccus sp.]